MSVCSYLSESAIGLEYITADICDSRRWRQQGLTRSRGAFSRVHMYDIYVLPDAYMSFSSSSRSEPKQCLKLFASR